jgi:hypothetical protein
MHQKEITIIKLYAPNINVPNFIKHTLKDLKTYINSNTLVVGDFNTPLSPVDRSSKQEINKEIIDLNNTTDQIDLADVYRIFHPTSALLTCSAEVCTLMESFLREKVAIHPTLPRIVCLLHHCSYQDYTFAF